MKWKVDSVVWAQKIDSALSHIPASVTSVANHAG